MLLEREKEELRTAVLLAVHYATHGRPGTGYLILSDARERAEVAGQQGEWWADVFANLYQVAERGYIREFGVPLD